MENNDITEIKKEKIMNKNRKAEQNVSGKGKHSAKEMTGKSEAKRS